MAQTGYTPIKLYYSTATGTTPLAANLALGELALNAYDGKLFYKNSNTGLVAQISAGGTPPTYTLNGVAYADTTSTLAANGNLTYNGTTLTVATDMVVSSSGQRLGVGSGGDAGSTVFGYQATNPTGTNAVAIGYQALKNNAAADNIGVGYLALTNNSSGTRNVAVGLEAGRYITTGGSNTGIGYKALRSTLGNGAGDQNSAVGQQALTACYGSYNAAVGSSALQAATTTNYSTAIGYQALNTVTTGNYNTGVGRESGKQLTTGSGNCILMSPNSSGLTTTCFTFTTGAENDRLVLGSASVANAYVQVAWTVTSDARDKTNVAPVPLGLDFVSKLNPVQYQYKASREDTEAHGPVRYGFLAQEVMALEGANPVIIDNENPEKLRYTDSCMVAILAQAIKELKAEFDAYKASHP